jgi:hypothetical protein
MRTKGSCRFEAYYKLEKWDSRRMCWKAIQRPYKTAQEARDTLTPVEAYRLLEVTESGYTIKEERR